MHTLRLRFIGLFAILALLTMSVGLAPAYASTFTVTNLNDSGAGSLRAAITTAGSGDAINFSVFGTITLASQLPDIAVTLTINGNLNGITVSGNGSRPLHVTSSGNLTLNNLTLSNGNGSASGGAILNEGSLTLNGSTISGNTAANGGGIYNDGGTVTINDSIITDNTATNYGGGLFNLGGSTVTLTDSTLSGNKTLGNDGGAIANFDLGSTINATRTTFSNNSTPTNGGAIANEYQQGTIEVTDSTFSGNSASNYGGAIYNGTLGVLTITGSTFTGNSASSEGGAVAHGSTIAATISGSTFTHNTAYYGGAVGLGGAGVTLNVSDSTFDGATQGIVASYGGGIWNYSGSTLNVSGSTFVGLHVDQLGGAIQNDGFNSAPTQTNVVNSTFYGNAAINGARGGAISNANNATLNVSNSTLSANLSYDGGGIANSAGKVSLGSSIIAANTDLNSVSPNLSGAFTSLGYNVIDDTSGAIISGATASNLTGAAAAPLNLGTLDDNGGPTMTMALGDGSVAINAGDPAFTPPPGFDQRGMGFPRVSGGRIDIGAFEVQQSAPPGQGTGESSTSSGGAETTLCPGNGSASVPGGSIYCRVIARDGQFLASPAEIGIQSILNLGVVQAINVIGMLPNGVTVEQFAAPIGLCLNGSGDVLFVSASDPNRTIQRLTTSAVGDLECVSLSSPGLVVMVGTQSGIAAPPPAPADGTALTDCQVTTTNAPLNLRAEPNTSAQILAKLPDNLTLTATAFVPGWHRVIYLDGQGWISDRFLKTVGACGG